MYLHEIFLQNTGPISECHVKPLFDDAGNPQPIMIVGPNGSGKTIFLSYIVDALTEFAKQAFRDTVALNSSGDTPYFRIIHPAMIRSGQRFSLSLLHFRANNDNLYYCEKCGVLEAASYSPIVKSVFTPIWNWKTEENDKDVSADEKTVETEMKNGAYAFFPATRREDPEWLNPESLKAHPTATSRRFDKKLDKPLWVGTCAEENISWVLDVFLDSLVNPNEQQKLIDFVNALQGQSSEQQPPILPQELYPVVNRLSFIISCENVKQILQTILQDRTVELILNFRNAGASRISIGMGDGRIILPTLQSLSEGQSQLFNLFATIIRYGERADLNKSIHLHEITGLVVIDEIAAHLHPTLQHDVLPELISLFPKVQFIVSSHSPLFLLGMEKKFGVDKVTILEMPEAKRINSERYSEFGKAFEYIQSTERFEEEIKQRFATGTKPIVLTEGPQDVRYIERALDVLGEAELLNSLDIEFVGIIDKNGKTHYGGDKGLNHFRNLYEANPSLYHRPILLLYDCDTQKSDEQVEKLWVRLIPKNAENTKVSKGIENLFPEALFTEDFYSELSKDDGGYLKRLDKSKFCDWICENGTATDFAKFDSIVQILKEFVEAN